MWHLSSPTRDLICTLCTGGWILNHWTTREVPDNLFSWQSLLIDAFKQLMFKVITDTVGLISTTYLLLLSMCCPYLFLFLSSNLFLPFVVLTENIIWLHFLSFLISYTFFFWLCCAVCGILVPQPGIEPGPLAVKAQSCNHWTTMEFPILLFLLLLEVALEFEVYINSKIHFQIILYHITDSVSTL